MYVVLSFGMGRAVFWQPFSVTLNSGSASPAIKKFLKMPSVFTNKKQNYNCELM